MATTTELMAMGMPGALASRVAKVLDTTLTDSSGGTASDTIAAMTNTAALTDSSGGTADDTIEAVPSDTLANNAAAANNNFAEVADELDAQRTLNTALINAVASLSAKVNELSNGG